MYALCALFLTVLLMAGCSESTIVLPHQSSPAVQNAQRLAAAKNAFAPAMADVEACELAVLRGTSIEELSYLAARADASTAAFAASENARLLPQSTKALARAARYYTDSCIAWRKEVKAEQDAMHKGFATDAARAALLWPMRTQSHYMMWVNGALTLGRVRTLLKDGPP
jgi:hypothetical protein